MPRYERRRLIFEGRVQGVGFRATSKRLAAGFRMGGWVRNLPDGRVELVAEGRPDELDRYLTALAAEFVGDIGGTRSEVEILEKEPTFSFAVTY